MIDWKSVWKEFDKWYDKDLNRNPVRKWPDIKRKIKQLVEKHSVYYNDYETD